MKKYVLQKNIKARKIGQIVELDNNSFFTIYYIKKGIIKPLQDDNQIKQQKVQDKQEKTVKQPKKSVKRGNKKK